MKAMQQHLNVITKAENDYIQAHLKSVYPELYEVNCDINLDDTFSYIDSFPLQYVSEVKSINARCVISNNGGNKFAGYEWHADTEDLDEVSVLLYLNGDNTQGGELQVGTNIYPFEVNSMLIMNSLTKHKALPYMGKQTRLAIKWKFKI